MRNLILDAKEYAVEKHEGVGQKYGDLPYSVHLEGVFIVGVRFGYILGDVGCREEVFASLWLHDVIEDCRVTYNDLRRRFPERVCELVYAVTNEKGRNREERASEVYYRGIRDCEWAVFVKLCDRIANVEKSKGDVTWFNDRAVMSRMYLMYRGGE